MSLLIPTTYLGPIQLYTHIYADPDVAEDRHEHFVKQTYRNRCYIATPTGAQPLTIPVERAGSSHTAVRDVRISDHGNWRHLHLAALTSAYENSPYYEYYADDFVHTLERPYTFLVDLNEALRDLVLSLLSLTPDIRNTESYTAPDALTPGVTDLRSVLTPKATASADPYFSPKPYYQVFSERTGFQSNLSIVDLLFNLGPESRLVLKASRHN